KIIAVTPLMKSDSAGRRAIRGYMVTQTPDSSGEAAHYDSSKPHIEQWRDRNRIVSGGKSDGNIRIDHTAHAVGKVTELLFDDAAKTVAIEGEIHDDDCWSKIRGGVLNCLSIGGRYIKKWTDPLRPDLTWYTAAPTEISIVDLGANPDCILAIAKSL